MCHYSAVFVEARNQFLNSNRDASIGVWAFGFLWGSYGALLLALLLFCVGSTGRKAERRSSGSRGYTNLRWRRGRSSQSGKSHESRRVKDEYS